MPPTADTTEDEMYTVFKQYVKQSFKKFYHTKLGQICWQKFAVVVNRPFIKHALQKALNIHYANNASGQEKNIIPVDINAVGYTKNALVIFPFWGYNATTFNIMSMCSSLRKLGYAIHAILYNDSDYSPSSESWDYIYTIKASHENFGKWNIHQNSSGLNRNRIDDWAGEELTQFVKGISKFFDFQICLCHYVFLSKAFETLPPDVFKILYTHDIFWNRNVRMANEGVPERDFYFSVSAEEEAVGLRRADLVLAVQEEERKYFVTLVGEDRASTLPYVPEKNYQPGRENPSPLVVGYIASGHAPNVKALQVFCEHFPGRSDVIVLIAGSICSRLDGIAFSKKVTLLGIVENLSGFYASCDVLINPDTLRSGLKVKCVEALSYGKPLVCTDAASAGIGVREPYHLVPDIAGCAEHIERIADNPRLLADMAAESRRVYDAFAEKYSSYEAFRSYDRAARAKRLAFAPERR